MKAIWNPKIEDVLEAIKRATANGKKPGESFEDEFHEVMKEKNQKPFAGTELTKEELWGQLVQDGKTILNPWFNTHYDESVDEKFVSLVSNLYFKLSKFLGKEPGEMTQAQFTKSLIGKKVKLSMTSGIYEKRTWTRIEVAEFVKE